MRRILSMALGFAMVVACRRPHGSAEHAAASAVPVASAEAPPAIFVPLVTEAPRGSSSELLLGRVAGRLVAVVADVDTQSLLVFDVDRGTQIAELALGGDPGHVIAYKDGVAATVREKNLVVFASFETRQGTLALAKREELSAQPDPLALAVRGESLWVLSAASARLERFEGGAHARASTTQLRRDPRAVLPVAEDKIMIAHASGSVVSWVDGLGNATSRGLEVDHKDFDRGMAPMPIEFSQEPIHRFIPVSQSYSLATYKHATLLATVTSSSSRGGGGYGGGGLNPTMRIDSLAFQAKNPSKLSLVTYNEYNTERVGRDACTLPRGILVEKDQAWVACAGEGEIQPYGLHAVDGYLVATAGKPIAVDPGVSAIAYDEGTASAVAYSGVTRAITVMANGGRGDKRRIALPASPLAADVLAGRGIFHRTDSAISSDKKACASCHPDGGDDGLVWNTPSGARRTMPLAGSLGGPVFGWEGQSKTLEAHVQNTLKKNLGGTGIGNDETRALLAYLRHMSPRANAPAPDRAAVEARGRAIFDSEDAACASCHKPSEGFRDQTVHNAGAGKMRTPTLRGIAGRSALFHDGRYRTLDELLAKTDGKMGATKHLAPEDRTALLAYLATL